MPNQLTRGEFLAALLAASGALAERGRAAGLGGMMWEFMLDYIQRLDKTRRERFESLQSPEDIEKLRQQVRTRLAEMWGPFPEERTPLNPRHVGTLQRADYLVEKIIYESRPRFFVTANLYRPKEADGRSPAVIFPPGHATEGKAYEAYQRFCILMVHFGFVVLTWDPVSQGERLQFWDPQRQVSPVRPGTGEHKVLGNQCYLLGLNLMQYRVWDAIRAIDYLETRPEVDADRIAMAGNSGGGMETLQFAGFEPRIKAAVPMCAVASFRDKTEALLIADPEQILYGTLRHGIDHPELLASFAPRPLLIGAATEDYVPIEGARRTFQAVSKAYGILGAADKSQLVQTQDKHGLNRELREAAAGWLLVSLGDERYKAKETVPDTEMEVASEQQLRCTPDGQVAASLNPADVHTSNRSYARKIAPQRKLPATKDEFEIYRGEIAQGVRDVTRVGNFKQEAGIFVPDRNFEVGAFARGVAFVVSDTGKDNAQLRHSIIDPLVAAGYQVVALDLRGWGESAPNLPDMKVSFSWDDFFAYRSLEIGRPLIGQRMKDLLGAAPKRTIRRQWMLVGVGAGALVAAHAAVLEPRFTSLISVGGLLSYQSLIDDPLTTHPVSSFLPGVIGAYDMRDVYAALAPRPVLVVNPMDSRQIPVARVPAWEQLDWTAQVYEVAGATAAFSLETQVSSPKMRSVLADWLKT